MFMHFPNSSNFKIIHLFMNDVWKNWKFNISYKLKISIFTYLLQKKYQLFDISRSFYQFFSDVLAYFTYAFIPWIMFLKVILLNRKLRYKTHLMTSPPQKKALEVLCNNKKLFLCCTPYSNYIHFISDSNEKNIYSKYI